MEVLNVQWVVLGSARWSERKRADMYEAHGAGERARDQNIA